jgi:hypothetical protein
MSEEPQDDVAISFLASDEKIASSIRDGLEGLKVFFFPGKQEVLAGTDGMETMQRPFVKARVNVVLFREPWGKTKWTAIEEEAIKRRCFEGDWKSLFFVMLDRSNKRPGWLAPSHVWFDLESYGPVQAIGAIKARVQEQGGTIERPNALSRARIVQREAEFAADRERLFRDRDFVDSASRCVEQIMKRIVEIGESVKADTRIRFDARAHRQQCVLRERRVSMNVQWQQSVSDVLGYMEVAEVRGRLELPGESRGMFERPRLLREHHFTPELSLSRELRWMEGSNRADLLTDEDVANRVVVSFVDLIDRANKGQVSFEDEWSDRERPYDD